MPTAPQPHYIRVFYHLLTNTVIASVLNYTVWFAITFYVFLQTRSVLATGIISGIYLVSIALTGFWFGSIVDHHRKKTVMIISSAASGLAYTAAFALYIFTPAAAFKNPANPLLWMLIILIMAGVLASNLRGIALPTTVTLLIPENMRDKINGLVGSTMGLSMLVTSVISGVLVGMAGMTYVLILAIAGMAAAIIHLFLLEVPEKKIVRTNGAPQKVDLKGTIAIISAIPGLFALIFFTTFNNFLGGVFMSLMDAYGLSLVTVEVWGFLWGFLSLGFIAGGILISKKGLGKNPLRTMLWANIIIWVISSIFTLHSSLLLLIAGLFVYMCLMPFIEASEQTVLQKVVPYERQGRVFGFAQSVEQAASPLTAFFIGPLTQLFFIPFMTTGAGVDLIGGWFGTGADRGMALVFTVTGIIGLIVTCIAFCSRQYRALSAFYAK